MHIVPSLDETGGMERVLTNGLLHTDASRICSMVCCVIERGELADKLDQAGIPVWVVSKRNRWDVLYPWRLAALLRAQQVDVVNSYSGVYRDGCLAGLLARVPVIVHTDHGRFNSDSTWTQWNHRFFSRFRDKVIGVSNGVGEFLIREVGISPHKVMTIYDGIDIGAFNNQLDCNAKLHELGLPEDHSLVGIIGRMVPIKDHQTFFRAARLVLQKVDKVVFVVAGDGPLEAYLRELVDELEISDKVHFLGFRDDVPELMHMFDLVVASSEYESFSLVLAEAMACGKAVVATRVGGIPEVVEDDVTGILVPHKNPEALAQSIVELLKDPARLRAMGQAGRTRVEELFSIEAMVRSYEDLYTSLLGQKGLVTHG